MYDLTVIGGGAAGCAAALRAAALGRRVALVTSGPPGGAHPRPVRTGVRGYTDAIGAALREARARDAATADELRAAGVRVIVGRGALLGATIIGVTRPDHTIEQLITRAVLLAPGVKPLPPGVPGAEQWVAYGPASLWQRRTPPSAAAVLGSGPPALELAACLGAWGIPVALICETGFLPGAEPSLVLRCLQALGEQGVQVLGHCRLTRLEHQDGSEDVTVHLASPAGNTLLKVDCLLLAGGEGAPDVNRDELQALGVTVGKRGITIDGGFMTAARGIYAAGEGTGIAYAHAASHGRAAAEAVCGLTTSFDPLALPYAVPCEPELAWVGLDSGGLQAAGIVPQQVSMPLPGGGEVRLVTGNDGRRLYGAHAFGPGAADIVGQLAPALAAGTDWQKAAAGLSVQLAVPRPQSGDCL